MMLAAAAAVMLLAAPAQAALRNPQIGLSNGELQLKLDSEGENINAALDQENLQRWASPNSGNTMFTLQMEIGGNIGANEIGLYDAAEVTPTLRLLLPSGATNGWMATASFKPGPSLMITTFDSDGFYQNQHSFPVSEGMSKNFGFYLSGPGTNLAPIYSEDARNPDGKPYVLTYKGVLVQGGWWLAFEDELNQSDFSNGILFVEAVQSTPVSKTSWGNLKSRFR